MPRAPDADMVRLDRYLRDGPQNEGDPLSLAGTLEGEALESRTSPRRAHQLPMSCVAVAHPGPWGAEDTGRVCVTAAGRWGSREHGAIYPR
jgi:hypothetical protein